MFEQKFPVATADISIDKLAELLSDVLGVHLDAGSPQSPGMDRRTQVHILAPENGTPLLVSVRNYASDSLLKREEVGVAVRGDPKYEDLLHQNQERLKEYFASLAKKQ